MKKLLLFITFAAAFVLAAFLLFTRLFTAGQPTGEPYVVQQAREAALVAQLDRDTADAAFRSTFIQWALIIILLLIVVVIFAALLLVFAVVAQRLRIEEIRARHDASLIMPTPEGNYPGVLTEDETGAAVIRVRPGNKPYPRPADNVIIGNSPMARIPTGRHDVPILINTHGNGGSGQRLASPSEPQYQIREVQPEQLEAPEQARSVQVQSTNDEPVLENGQLLAELKAKGEPKQASIEALTGVKKGGSKAYKAYSEFWDSLA
jgi:hypothetical protein